MKMKTIYKALLLLSVVTAFSPSASAQSYGYNYYGRYDYYYDYYGAYRGGLIRRLDAQGRGGHAI
jgi:hypothetical protein